MQVSSSYNSTMESDVRQNLPKPVFRTLARDLSKLYCEICLRSWDKRNQKRANLRKIDKIKFKTFAEKWELVDHHYNKINKRVEWSRESMLCCKSCHSMFFKEDYLKKQKNIDRIPIEDVHIEDVLTTPEVRETLTQIPLRSSNRKKFKYETNRDVEENRQCIICCNVKRNKKGKIIPVTLISLRDINSKYHKAEETLLKFARIHVKHETKYKDAAERVLLVSSTSSLFAADVGYHRVPCYQPFRSAYWENLEIAPIHQPKTTPSPYDSFKCLCELVKHHIIEKREIYTLTDLKRAYESLRTENCPILRVGDIKYKLSQEFPNEIIFSSSPKSLVRNEYVLPSGESLTSEVIAAATEGRGISKTALIRSLARRLHNEIMNQEVRRPWPPTPQDILEDLNPFHPDTFNHIAWIVEPDAPLGKEGLVKLSSKRKELKVIQICRNIESLLPNAQPSLDQVLLSLVLHRKTGSRDILDTIHRLGLGISYRETLFIENKWAEWDKEQNSSIPANIEKGILTTMVADNIDWKNKCISGKETHNTNCILIQHDSNSDHSRAKVNLQPNYNFDKRKHKSFQSEPEVLPTCYFKKTDCEKFVFNNRKEIVKGTENSELSSLKTLSWVLCRKENVSENVMYAWSAFQSKTSSKPSLCEVNVGYLPAITESPTKYETILRILNICLEVKNELELDFIYLEVDQAIYTKILQLNFQLRKEGRYEYANVIVRMGGFHVIICLMRSIYSRFTGFGFVELLAQVGGLGGAGTIENALKGGDVKLGIRLYKLLFEALYRIKIRFVETAIMNTETANSPSLQELILATRKNLDSDNIQELMGHPDISQYFEPRQGDMAFWLDSILEMINLMLNIIHFYRTGNWNGYFETLYQFLPYCFALNRHNYARNLSYYYLDMIDLQSRNPEAYEYLERGGFTGSLTGSVHSNIPMDQIIEMTINRFSKSTGGVGGKTEDTGASEKWVRLNHYLCALKEHMNKKLRKNRAEKHIEFGERRRKKDESDVETIIEILDLWVPNIYSEEQALINISNGLPASKELIQNAKSLTEIGRANRDSFFERIATFQSEDREGIKLRYNDPITRQNVIKFSTKETKKKYSTIPEDEGQSFADILSRYDKKYLDFEYLMKWPVTSRPWSICNEEDKSRNTSKHLFRDHLQKLSPMKFTRMPPDIPIYIVDAMRVVRIISVANLKPPTFETWAFNVFKYIDNLPGEVIHVVFDVYPDNVDLSRPSKGRYNSAGQHRHISSLSQQLPPTSAWNDFLASDKNKHQLSNLLIDYVLYGSCPVTSTLYVTKGNKCFLKTLDGSVCDVAELSSNHKEADPRLAFHAVYASALTPNKSICVVSDDTDVYILLLSVASQMNGNLYFRQGTSSGRRGIEFHNVSSLANFLGENCCKNLPAFHALTGSDFTYPFFRRTKYRAFTIMMNLKNVKNRSTTVHQLESLGSNDPNYDMLIDFVLHTIYNRPLYEKSPKDSRVSMLFSGKGKTRRFRSTKVIPPDESSLIMKLKRTNLVTHCWKQCCNSNYTAMDPTCWGWEIKNDNLIPVWYEGSNIPTDAEYDTYLNDMSHIQSTDIIDLSENDSSASGDDSEECNISENYSTSEEGVDEEH